MGPSALYGDFGIALIRAQRPPEEAVSAFKKAIQIEPDNIIAHLNLTGTYVMMGREKEARAEAAEVLRISKFSLDNYARTGVRKQVIDALRKALSKPINLRLYLLTFRRPQ